MALPKMVVVVGTNASGKSALGVALAKRYNGEVISADSRQVYKGLDLGSGKITQEEMQGVPHHLLDVCEPGVQYTMADFQKAAYAAADDILARGKLPFLVGGTGLYVAAVAEGYQLSDITPNLDYRKELEGYETEELYRKLQSLVPDTAIDPHNRNRVMRALEKLADGDTQPPQREKKYDTLKIGVTWDREVLRQRIDERLERRMAQGMVDEVRGLLDAGVSPQFLDKLGLEYRFISRYILGQIGSEGEMCAQLAQAIKKFAKRQMTWFRRDGEIRWLDMEFDPMRQAQSAVEEFLKA